MDAVGLHELPVQRDVLEDEADQRRIETRRELRVHRGERLTVGLAVVRRYLNSGQDDVGSALLAELDHLREVVAQGRDGLAAQAVIATELDDDQVGLVSREQARQTCEAAGRRVPRDAGIHYPISVTF